MAVVLLAALVAERLLLQGALVTAWASRVGPLATRALSRLSGLVPLSLAEIALIGLALATLGGSVRLIVRLRRAPRAQRRTLLLRAAGTVVVVALAIVLAFDLSWGVYYRRAGLAERMGWTSTSSPDGAAAELVRLATALVDKTNVAYEALGGGRDLGRVSVSPSRAEIEAALEAGYASAAGELPGEAGMGQPRGRAKPMLLLSPVMCRLGISGFYFPWTGEANYNRLAPSCSRPHVIAHEKAHQRGFASEDEAEFAGWLACRHSPDPYVRYSGWLFAQRELLFELRRRDPQAAAALVARRDPGVQRDVSDLIAFWRRFEGRAAQVSEAVNDRYLRAQGVKGGIESYRLGARLIVLHARAHME